MAQLKIDIILNDGGAEQKLAGVETALGRVGDKARQTGDTVAKAFQQRMVDGLGKAEQSLTRFGSKLSSIGSSWSLAITAPITAMGGFAVKAAIDFESSFAGVRKTVNATEAEFAVLSQGLRDMAKTIPVSVNELNRIAEAAGQLGIEKEHILRFTRVMADLAVTTNLTSDQAAMALARFANITQMPQEEFDRLGSTIVHLGNNLATTEAEIVEFGLRIAGAGHLAGLSEANILAIGAAMSSVGVEAEAGGTAVQKVLLGMTQAVATGNKDLAAFAATAGMTAQQFQALFKSNPAEAFTRFVEGLGASGQKAFVILEQLGLQDQRLIRGFLSLANAGDVLRTSVDLGTQAWRENTALTKEAGERYKTTAGQLKTLWNNVYDLAITLGNQLIPIMMQLLPSIQNVLQGVSAMVSVFASLPQGVQTVIVGLVAFTAAIGPLAFGIGQILTLGGSLAGLFSLLAGTTVGSTIATAATAVGGFGASLLAIPYLGIAAGIAAMAGGFALLVVDIRRSIDELGFFETMRRKLPGQTLGGAGAMIGTGAGVWAARALWGSGGAPPGLPGQPSIFQPAKPGGLNTSGFGQPSSSRPPPVIPNVLSEEQKRWQADLDKLSGREAIKVAQEWIKKVQQIGGATKLAASDQLKYTEALDAGMEAFERLNQVPDPTFLSVWAGQQKILAPALATTLSQATLLSAEMKAIAQQSIGWMGYPSAKGIAPELIEPDGQGGYRSMGSGIPFATTLSSETIAMNLDNITKVVSPWREAFSDLGKSLPDIVFGALQGGGSIVGSIAAGLAAKFSGAFQSALAEIQKSGGTLGAGMTALGLAGAGLTTAIAGFAMGKQHGKAKGALGGAAAGALAGTAIMPGIGTAVGAGIGAIAGFFGGRAKEKEARKQMEEQRAEWIKQYGGMEKLTQLADQLGVSLGNAFTTKKPEEFQRVVERLNVAIEKQQNLLEGIDKITAGTNARAQNIGSQSGMNVVGAGALASFMLQVQQGTSAVVAIESITGALTAMRDAAAGGTFQMGAAGQRLIELSAIIEANRVPFQNLAADGQILQGMMQGNIRDFGLFSAVAADIGVQLQGMIDRGVPTAQVLALAQPQLQALWEAQQRWHFAVDATTQSLLDQAAQQGLVGEHVKSVHEQILTVLLAIGDVLGAQIPAALKGLPGAAEAAAAGMNTAFRKVRPPDVAPEGQAVPRDGQPAATFHRGGLIGGLGARDVPIIGQRGEFVMSRRGVAATGVGMLSAMNRGQAAGGGGGVVVNVTVQGSIMREDEMNDAITEAVLPRLAQRARAYGLVP